MAVDRKTRRARIRTALRWLTPWPQAAITTPTPLCAGTGAFIHEDTVDGTATTTCPICRRYRPAIPVGFGDRWWAVTAHTARHAPACLAAGPIRCVCPLNDNEEPF